MLQTFPPESRKKIVRLYMEEGRTYKSIIVEYGMSKSSISKWYREFNEECQEKALSSSDTPNEMKLMKENLQLRKELKESRKKILFKKSNGILCKVNRLEVYQTTSS